jgi:trimeric autotransporter adhesin
MLKKQIFQSLLLSSLLATGLYGSGEPIRLTARHIESKGIGYNQGYTTLEGFLAPGDPYDHHWVPFVDLRGHVFNNGKYAANAGVGLRYLASSRVWGINTYYDYRQSPRRHYNQAALGLESLGKSWDFRMNGYLPLGLIASSRYQTHFQGFKNHSILLSSKREFTLAGGNFEAGYHVNSFKNFPIYLAAGPYYLEGKGKKGWGGQLRGALDIYNYVRIEGNASYDNLFKWIGQGQLSLTFAFGGKKKEFPLPHSLFDSAVQRVDRFEIIPVDTKKVTSKAIDPLTGQPYFVWFVDNTSHSLGTYESPFNNLADAQNASIPGDVIYVFSGNGTYIGMNNGIVLKNNQRFWGSGTTHQLATQSGVMTLPAKTSAVPLITNSSGDGITLANNVDVSGFYMTRASGNGIVGTNVGSVSITDMTIFASGSNGILIDETANAPQTLSFDRLTIVNNGIDGIRLNASNSSIIKVNIENSTLSLNGNTTGNGITLSSTGSAVIHGTVYNNTLDANKVTAINIDSTSHATAPLLFTINNNHIKGHNTVATAIGGAISGNFTGTAPCNLTMNNNIMEGNQPQNLSTRGLNFFHFGGGASIFTARDNQISGNYPGSIRLESGDSTLTGFIEGNIISKNNYEPIRLFQTGVGSMELAIANNTIEGNCDSAILIDSPLSNSTLSFTNNVMSGNYGNGIECPYPISASTLTFTNNIMTGNSGDGISLRGVTISASTLTFTNNIMSGNCGYGICFNNSSITASTLTFTNNQVQGNTRTGIIIDSVKSGTTIALLDNIIQGNLGSGIEIDYTGTGANGPLSIVGNQIDNNQQAGILINTSSTSGPSSVEIVNNTIQYNFSDGITQNMNFGPTTIIISSNTLAFNQGSGLNLIGAPTSTLTLPTTISNNKTYNNNRSGLSVNSSGDSAFIIQATDNTLYNNNPFLALPNSAGFKVTNSAATASTCLHLESNSSDTGYLFTQTAGTFNVTPGGVGGAQGINAGQIYQSGTIGSTCP